MHLPAWKARLAAKAAGSLRLRMLHVREHAKPQKGTGPAYRFLGRDVFLPCGWVGANNNNMQQDPRPTSVTKGARSLTLRNFPDAARKAYWVSSRVREKFQGTAIQVKQYIRARACRPRSCLTTEKRSKVLQYRRVTICQRGEHVVFALAFEDRLRFFSALLPQASSPSALR